MKTSQNGINLIKSFEDLKLESYKCPAGIWTIGYGHTANVKPNQKISELQADTLLAIDLQRFENAVNNLVAVPLTQNQFDALVSFVFNVGIGDKIKKTGFISSTLLTLLNSGDYNGAAEQFKRWNKSKGKVLNGLTHRRKAERELFLSS